MDRSTTSHGTTRRWQTTSTSVGLLALLAIMALIVMGSPGAWAASTHRVVTDRSLGVSLTLPAGWQRLNRVKDAPHGITLVGGPGRVTTIEALGTSRVGTPKAIAQSFACGLTHGYGNLPLQRRQVRYAGAPGVMLLGMPGNRATVQIVLVSHSVVYHLTLPGRTLARDQRMVLANLRFVPVTKNSPVLIMAPRVKPCGRLS